MFFKSLTAKEIRLVILLFVFSAVNSLLEGVGITVFFPLLIGSQQTLPFHIPPPFDKILYFFLSKSFPDKLRWVALCIVTIAVLRVMLFMVIIRLSLTIRERIIKVLKLRCVDVLMHSRLGYFNKKKLSDLQLIFEDYIDNSIGMIIELSLNILTGIFTTLLLLSFLLLLSWQITLVCLVVVAVLSLSFSLYSRHIHAVGHLYMKAKATYNKTLLDILQGMKIIRIFNCEKHMLGRFEHDMDHFHKSYFNMGSFTGSVGPFFEFGGVLLMGGVLWLAASILPVQEGSQMPFVITFLIVLARLLPPLKSLNHARGAIVARLPAWEEVKNFFKQNNMDMLQDGGKKFSKLEKAIEFQKVGFRYNENDNIVLDQISFTVPQGKKIGIVGGSGAGKSTITELVLRFYDPQEGSIIVDGINLKDLDIKSFRKKIGVVLQDTFLFHETIRANIAFANLEASFEDIQKAAKQAYAHDFIMQMPQGYDTVIGDRGILISGGQRQRIAIARAILMNPDILIFDEATSALDSDSEQIVQKALAEISQGKTVITIAHRLSTIAESDRIIVLERGRIIEEGTHDELIKRDGRYHQLAQLQLL